MSTKTKLSAGLTAGILAIASNSNANVLKSTLNGIKSGAKAVGNVTAATGNFVGSAAKTVYQKSGADWVVDQTAAGASWTGNQIAAGAAVAYDGAKWLEQTRKDNMVPLPEKRLEPTEDGAFVQASGSAQATDYTSKTTVNQPDVILNMISTGKNDTRKEMLKNGNSKIILGWNGPSGRVYTLLDFSDQYDLLKTNTNGFDAGKTSIQTRSDFAGVGAGKDFGDSTAKVEVSNAGSKRHINDDYNGMVTVRDDETVSGLRADAKFLMRYFGIEAGMLNAKGSSKIEGVNENQVYKIEAYNGKIKVTPVPGLTLSAGLDYVIDKIGQDRTNYVEGSIGADLTVKVPYVPVFLSGFTEKRSVLSGIDRNIEFGQKVYNTGVRVAAKLDGLDTLVGGLAEYVGISGKDSSEDSSTQ